MSYLRERDLISMLLNVLARFHGNNQMHSMPSIFINYLLFVVCLSFLYYLLFVYHFFGNLPNGFKPIFLKREIL